MKVEVGSVSLWICANVRVVAPFGSIPHAITSPKFSFPVQRATLSVTRYRMPQYYGEDFYATPKTCPICLEKFRRMIIVTNIEGKENLRFAIHEVIPRRWNRRGKLICDTACKLPSVTYQS